MMIDLNSLRKSYPFPQASPRGKSDEAYCVGGALAKALGHVNGFPPWSQLAEYLMEANSQLSRAHAAVYAKQIIRYNNWGWFEQAWRKLGQALEEGGGCQH